jgi:uncharacterized protein (DUF1778 family)
MTKQTTIRFSDEMSETLAVTAQIKNMSINEFVINAVEQELARTAEDELFVQELKQHVKKYKNLLDRLAL